MKALFLIFITLLLPCLLFAAEPPRQQINFNREWKFQLGDHPGAEAAGYDDTKWDDIGLPHSFSMPYFESRNFTSATAGIGNILSCPRNRGREKMYFSNSTGRFRTRKFL